MDWPKWAIGIYFRFGRKRTVGRERLLGGKICMGPSIMVVQGVYKATALSNNDGINYLQMQPNEPSCRKHQPKYLDDGNDPGTKGANWVEKKIEVIRNQWNLIIDCYFTFDSWLLSVNTFSDVNSTFLQDTYPPDGEKLWHQQTNTLKWALMSRRISVSGQKF